MRSSRVLLTALFACSLFLVSCGGGGSSDGSKSDDKPAATASGSSTGDATVKIADFAFGPGATDVHVGDTVTFANHDSATHTAESDTSAPKAFDTGKIKAGSSAEVTFAKAGDYSYHCGIHEYMTGTIRVLK